MLNFRNIALRRGKRLLFAESSFTLHAGNRIGLTGANGSGKSSLFAVLRGELPIDAGDVEIPDHLTIAHVAQETPAVDQAAIAYVMEGDHELCRLENALAAAENRHDHHAIAQLHTQLDNIDGYRARSRAARLLHGLGFTTAQESHAVRTFSGGWRMRLNLAQALMCRSDLLLLDEPTNHLDLDAILWLEQWLQAYPGTLILISHDRDFLDNVIDHVIHIDQGRALLYTGNYSAFETRRAEELAQQHSSYLKQQREISHIRSFIDRFKAQATKARQAQSRIKALERIQLITPAHVDSPFHFSFFEPLKNPTPLLKLDKVAVGYHGDRPIITKVELNLAPGDRLGLLGPNGAGKSTLIKLLAGELPALSGKIEPATTLKIGYFAQHHLEQLHLDESPINHLQRLDPQRSAQELRDYIGGFGFNGDMALEPIAPLSGGEKARLVLALLVYQRPNLLLLDEPTNHLDMEMRLALTLALQEYSGALVVVSHDRHLLRSVTDQLLLVAHGGVTPFDGDVDEYTTWLTTQHKAANEPNEPEKNSSLTNRKDQRRLDAEKRQRLQPLKKELQQVEQQLQLLSEKMRTIETTLLDAAIYTETNRERLKRELLEQSVLRQRLEENELRWLALSEALESSD